MEIDMILHNKNSKSGQLRLKTAAVSLNYFGVHLMKISWKNFERRVIELHMSWRLSILAIQGFKDSGEALDSYLTEDYQDFIGLLSESAKTSGKQITDFPAYQTFDEFKPER
ncbi:hypothetical protein KJ830_09000 [bacterium]|nr:hypothetical protein [bacterium]MBU4511165.1 hypothetical protein [bacterium]